MVPRLSAPRRARFHNGRLELLVAYSSRHFDEAGARAAAKEILAARNGNAP